MDNKINQIVGGLNRDNIKKADGDYISLLNGLFNGVDDGVFTLTNEPSNLLASKFKEGFKVINATNDIYSRNTYFFLVNPETGVGEFGYIRNNQNIVNIPDAISDCDDCIDYHILPTPLEDIEQTELNEYVTLLTDACHIENEEPEKGFNFDVNSPIKKTVIKNEKCGKTIYFTDFKNEPRYIVLDNITQYQETGSLSCGVDETTPTCLDADKMLLFRKYNRPNLTATSIDLGGRLLEGMYEFLISYCDQEGNEISEYVSITNPISIFDRNNITRESEENFTPTNFAIRLEVEELDKRYDFYKIAVIQNNLRSQQRVFIEGVHPVSNNVIVYSGDQGKLEISLTDLLRENLYVKRTALITEANNHLVLGNIVSEKEINLQPIANLIGGFLKWQTYMAKEDIYKDGVTASKLMSENRDEVVPYGIRFLLDGGFKTAVFPLVARPPKETDLEVYVNDDLEPVDTDNIDVVSYLETAGVCQDTQRRLKWQYENTASSLGFCNGDSVPTREVLVEVKKNCFIEDLASLDDESFTVELTSPFTSLEDYIEDNIDNPEAFGDSGLYDFLQLSTYEEDVCTVEFESFCGTPELDFEGIEVTSITGENFVGVEKAFPSEYSDLPMPQFCNPYQTGSQGTPAVDTQFEEDYYNFPTNSIDVYFRNEFSNTSCINSEELIFNQSLEGLYHNYEGASNTNDLQVLTRFPLAGVTSAIFFASIHKEALYFRSNIENKNEFIIRASKRTTSSSTDVFDSTQYRVSIFTSCSASTAVYSQIYNANAGFKFRVFLDGTQWKINNGTSVVNLTAALGNNIFIAIEAPITVPLNNTKFVINPGKGCFSLNISDIELSSGVVSWDSITIRKKMTYKSVCTYDQPVLGDCESIPYEYGEFAYWESQETYPDNTEVYDSTRLLISETDISTDLRDEFENLFVAETEDGNYFLNENTNLACKKIRHFKFPDNKVSPFIYNQEIVADANSIIFPLGVTIDERIIVDLLNVAVKNGLITQEQRNRINKYEILRGDISLDRSVVSSGLLFDTRKYKKLDQNNREVNEDIFYSNYPFNDLGNDVLNLDKDGNFIEHPFGGESNNKFTFHSPETDYFRPTLPTELSVQGYMFGESANTTDEVLGHSKWVILTSRAKDLSSILATTETAAEIAIQAAMAFSNTNAIYGFSNTVIPGGLIASAIITAIGVAEGIVSKVGRYRLEWQNTFRNLGTPTNFAYYSYATGKYNFLKQTDLEFQNLRSLSVRAYINESEGIVNDEITGETYLVNNLHRERAVFISTPRAIDYYDEYREWDNNTLNNQTSSLTFASRNNMCTQGESAKYYRNIASPYVALKNYLPRQHGSINAINWLTTGYVGDLSSPKESCFGIFGGDTFIARHTLKRKIPFFLQDMVGEADMRPFNYKFYSNIGARARYFVDYEILSDFRERNILFPDIQYDFNLDCTTRAGLYYRTPSKFYLYSYGFPSFLAETRINTYNRTAKPGIEGNFFPNAPIRQYTQEREVSIQRNESFNYSTIYSKGVTKTASRMLAFNFSQADNDCRNDKPNGIHWSLPDNSENNYSDPWLVFRPLNYYEFPTTYGALKDLRTIENEQILVRCENTTALYNAVDSTIDDGKAPEARNLLTSFARRPAVYSETDLGYGGTDSTNSVSCEYGHFHVDAKRGQVIQIPLGGGGMQDIASTIDGKPSGLANWLRFHLPFFILRDFPNLDVDNPWNGLGITMGWDARLKRVFITKKDYRTKVDCITYEDNNFYYNQTECEEVPQIPTCQEGFTYNAENQFCERIIENSQQTDIVFVMDNSNSMSNSEINQLNNFVQSIVTQLEDDIISDNVRVSIVKFAATAQNRQSLTNDLDLISDAIFSARLTNTTNIIQGLCIAKTEIENNGRLLANKRIILITDGVHTPPTSNTCGVVSSDQGVLTLGETLKSSGVDITLIAIGVEGEQILVLNTYGGTNDETLLDNYPLSSLGNGVNGYSSFSTEFSTASSIVDEIIGEIETIEQVEPTFEDSIIQINLTDTRYFEDKSWTLGFDVVKRRWIGWYSYTPNYYVSHNDYFQTGFNNESDFGLWSHLLTNKSYQVFQGRKYPFYLEYQAPREYNNKTLKTIEYECEARRYHNEFDYAVHRDRTFNKAAIFSTTQDSGNLELDYNTGQISLISKYPITAPDNKSQKILVTNSQDKYTINYFYNRVLKNYYNSTIRKWDTLQIKRVETSNVVKFSGKNTLEYLSGAGLNVQLIQDKDTHFRYLVNILVSKNG